MRDLINEFRKKKLKLKPITYLSGSYTHPFDVPHGYIWSPHLVPKPKGQMCIYSVLSHCSPLFSIIDIPLQLYAIVVTVCSFDAYSYIIIIISHQHLFPFQFFLSLSDLGFPGLQLFFEGCCDNLIVFYLICRLGT